VRSTTASTGIRSSGPSPSWTRGPHPSGSGCIPTSTPSEPRPRCGRPKRWAPCCSNHRAKASTGSTPRATAPSSTAAAEMPRPPAGGRASRTSTRSSPQPLRRLALPRGGVPDLPNRPNRKKTPGG
jgi:hypothetical protein